MKRFFICLFVIVAASVAADIYTTAPSLLSPLSISTSEASAPLPSLGKLPTFSLTDSEGKPFSSTTLEGKIWVANFFFTSCPQICPRMNREVAKLVERFKGNDRIQFVSITIDPEHDTAAVLKKYKTELASGDNHWHLLTGSVQEVRSLAEDAFKVGGYEDKNLHSTRLIVIDPQMNIRGYFPALEEEGVKTTIKAIDELLK